MSTKYNAYFTLRPSEVNHSLSRTIYKVPLCITFCITSDDPEAPRVSAPVGALGARRISKREETVVLADWVNEYEPSMNGAFELDTFGLSWL